MDNIEAQKIIKKMLDEDQEDRHFSIFKKFPDKIRLQSIGKSDQKRIRALTKILRSKPRLRGLDYFRAGLIFQHGQSIYYIKNARKLAQKSFSLGYEPGKWLYAAATDRILMMQGKKQRFGTQFRKNEGKWELHPIMSKTTDLERKRYNVASMSTIKRMLKNLNAKPNNPGSRKRIGLSRLK